MKNKNDVNMLVLVEMNARDISRIHIKNYSLSPEFNEPKYRMSQRVEDSTPIFLFNNCLRQELMDAAVWHDFLKYKN